MRSGQLRHRLILQSKFSVARDTYGAETVTWGTEKEVWGSIEPLTSREDFQAQQMQSDDTHKMSRRYLDRVRPDWRIKFGTRIFDIKSVINPEERNIEWTLLAKESLT